MSPKKKKMLIVCNNLETGGVQKSLINLLQEIKDFYAITVYVFSKSGELKDRVPENITVLEGTRFLKLLGLSQKQVRQEGFWLYVVRAFGVLFTKIVSHHWPVLLLVKSQERLTDYEVAISFLQSFKNKNLAGGCNELVLHRVAAKQKITYLHCDFPNYGGDTEKNRELIKQFNKIAAVSESCRQGFIKAVPELAAKTYCVYNCLDYVECRLLSNENPIVYQGGCLNIVTVARLSPDKGLIRTLEVLRQLHKEGRKIWHILGEGPERKVIEEKIKHYGLAESVSLYGNQKNPYRFMKHADALLLPSYQEAAPLVFGEAKALGLPILTTNTCSAKEMVLEGREGFICENSRMGLYTLLRETADNPAVLLQCREYMQSKQYTNDKAFNQFRTLID